MALWGTQSYASQKIYVTTIGIYRLTIDYCGTKNYTGNHLKISLNGNNLTQISVNKSTWNTYTLDINITTTGNQTLVFKGN